MVNSALMSLQRVLLVALGVLASFASAQTYTVKAGDTLYRVARAHNIDAEELMKLNNLETTTIEVGQVLNVPGVTDKATTPAPSPATPASDNSRTGVVRAAALKFMGIPYRLGATGQGGIDCSAFTRAVMERIGIRLPRTTREQFKIGTPIAKGDLRAGDLVFFNTLGNGVSHVGIYLGNGQFAHANSYAGRTVIESMGNVYYQYRYIGARRVLPGA